MGQTEYKQVEASVTQEPPTEEARGADRTLPEADIQQILRPPVSLDFLIDHLRDRDIPFFRDGDSLYSPAFFRSTPLADATLSIKVDDAWDSFFLSFGPTISLVQQLGPEATHSIRLLGVSTMEDFAYSLAVAERAHSFLREMESSDVLRLREIDVISREEGLARLVFVSNDFRLYRVYLSGDAPVVEQLCDVWVGVDELPQAPPFPSF